MQKVQRDWDAEIAQAAERIDERRKRVADLLAALPSLDRKEAKESLLMMHDDLYEIAFYIDRIQAFTNLRSLIKR